MAKGSRKRVGGFTVGDIVICESDSPPMTYVIEAFPSRRLAILINGSGGRICVDLKGLSKVRR